MHNQAVQHFFSIGFIHCCIPKSPNDRDLKSVASPKNFIASWTVYAFNRGCWQSLRNISHYLDYSKLATTEVYLKRGIESVLEEAAHL